MKIIELRKALNKRMINYVKEAKFTITLLLKVVIASFWMTTAITLVVKVVITSFWMIAVITLVVKVLIACFWMIVQCNISSEGGGLMFLDDSCYF